MKYRFTISIIFIGLLVLSAALPCFANNSDTTAKPGKIFSEIRQDVKTVVHGVVKAFKSAKTKTVRTTRTVKRDIKKGFRGAKTKTVRNTQTAKRSIKKGFKDAKTETKRTVKSVKKSIVSGLKGFKNN